MFKVGDQVRIKPEWSDNPDEETIVFTVINVNEVTQRCYIEATLPGLALPVQNLVGFNMIEKIKN